MSTCMQRHTECAVQNMPPCHCMLHAIAVPAVLLALADRDSSLYTGQVPLVAVMAVMLCRVKSLQSSVTTAHRDLSFYHCKPSVEDEVSTPL